MMRMTPAQERLFESHRSLALALVRRYAPCLPRYLSREDLEGPALLGLWEAARRYDPQRGTAFATLAYLCIGRALCECLRASSARGTAGRSRGSSAPPEPFAVSLQAPCRAGEGAGQWEDLFADPEAAAVLDRVPLRLELEAALAALPPRSRAVVEGRYVEGLSAEEVARRLGLPPRQVDWIASSARARLRRHLEALA